MLSQIAKRIPRLPALAKVLLIAIGLLALYVPVLQYEEHRVEARLARLRTEAPDAYLGEVRRREGFDAYLSEYAALNGYDAWHPTAPPFLLGRWALFETKQHVDMSFMPGTCHPSIEFEGGRIKLSGKHEAAFAATYRIRHGQVVARLNKSREMPIDIHSVDDRIYYIELQPPDSPGTLYGYRCG